MSQPTPAQVERAKTLLQKMSGAEIKAKHPELGPAVDQLTAPEAPRPGGASAPDDPSVGRALL